MQLEPDSQRQRVQNQASASRGQQVPGRVWHFLTPQEIQTPATLRNLLSETGKQPLIDKAKRIKNPSLIRKEENALWSFTVFNLLLREALDLRHTDQMTSLTTEARCVWETRSSLLLPLWLSHSTVLHQRLF